MAESEVDEGEDIEEVEEVVEEDLLSNHWASKGHISWTSFGFCSYPTYMQR